MAKLSVLILGSGAGGLFLARELCQNGCDVTLAGEHPLAQFASTRNQGWLQAGALYAGLGQSEVARECMLASRALGRLAPSAVAHHRRCFYLFEYQTHAEEFFENAAAAGIDVRPIVDPHALRATANFLTGSPYDFGIEAFDRPFNARHVLEIVRNQAVILGCKFAKVSIKPGCVRQSGSRWLLSGQPANYDKVVIAAGAQTATLASALGYTLAFGAMWITVLSVAGVQLDSMLLSSVLGKPNLVPFAPDLGDGFTAILAKRDSFGDPDNSLVPREKKLIEDGIDTYFPAISALMKGAGVVMKAHTCTKLAAIGNPAARGALIKALDTAETLWTFYPGKFTTSLLAARDCARVVQGSPSGVAAVSAQPYP
jgi:glycine/D-amino acid oxidase-like deaminating enzyme